MEIIWINIERQFYQRPRQADFALQHFDPPHVRKQASFSGQAWKVLRDSKSRKALECFRKSDLAVQQTIPRVVQPTARPERKEWPDGETEQRNGAKNKGPKERAQNSFQWLFDVDEWNH